MPGLVVATGPTRAPSRASEGSHLGAAPWLAIVPGLMIALAVASFNFVGDGLRDALDARLEL